MLRVVTQFLMATACFAAPLSVVGFYPTSVSAQGISLPDPARIEAQMTELRADVPGSVFALNPFRNTQEAQDPDGSTYRLTSLNPQVNSWFVLDVVPPSGAQKSYHLENVDPSGVAVRLRGGAAPALVIDSAGL